MIKKRMDQYICSILALLLIALVFPCAANAESELVPFESALLPSFDEDVDSPRDLTQSVELRALLAAVLQFEYYAQMPDHQVDVTRPIYLAINENDVVTAAFCAGGEYVMVFYIKDPLTTAYSLFGIDDPEMMKYVLEGTNESLWEISLNDFLEQLQFLTDALSK